MRMRSWLAMVGWLGGLALPASGGIFVVDAANGPGTDFTTLSAALGAVANTGGTLLVRTGTYVGPHTVTMASTAGELAIIADDGADVRIESPIQALPKMALRIDLAPGASPRRVVLRGLTFAQTNTGGPVTNLVIGTALSVNAVNPNDPVDVVVDECVATETIGHGAILAGGRRILVSNSTLVGGTPFFVVYPDGTEVGYTVAGHGLAVFGTTPSHTAWVYSSWLEGGPGAPVHFFPSGISNDAGYGGTGYFAWQQNGASTVPWGIVDTHVAGGPGGAGGATTFPSCVASGDGGSGLESWEKTQVYSVHSTYVGGAQGAPGADPSCVLEVGDPGPNIGHGTATFTGFHTPLPGTPGRAMAPRAMREGQTKSFGVEGAPGDAAFLFLGITQTAAYAYAISGALVVDPVLLLPVGTIGPGGTVTIPATLPNLGPGLDGFPLLSQAFTAESGTGYIRAGAPSVTMLLDSQF